MKRRISKRNARINLAVLLSLSATGSLMAADSTWSAAPVDGAWANSANWDGAVVPGNTSGTAGTSTDLAYFTGLPTQRTIAIDANRNIKDLQVGSIEMPDGTTSAYTIGADGANAGNALYLSNGGAIRVLSSFTLPPGSTVNEGKIITLNAPMYLTGTSYSFVNDAGSVTDTRPGLNIFGTITAGAGAPTTITFSATAGTSASSRNENQAQITDGAGGAIVSIVKSGPGCWEFNQSDSAPNTYSGDTILNEGTLRTSATGTFNGLGGFSPNSHYIINSGAVLRNSAAGSTVKAVTINPGGSLSVSTSSSTTLNFAATSGPALHFNFGSGTVTTYAVNAPFNLKGNVPLQGGIKLTSNENVGSITIGATTSIFDLGTVMREFSVGKGNAANAFDLRMTSTIIGGGAGAGILKTGAGTLRFDAATSTWTGQLEIREGDVRGNIDNVFAGVPDLLISGGNLHVFGTAGTNIQTFASMTATKGSITAGSTIASTVRSPSFTLNVGAGDTFAAAAILADSSGPAALIKSGAGAATLTGANTYSAGTTVNGGILGVNTNSEDIIINPGTPGANITAGRIVFDYTGGTSPSSTIVPILDAGYDVNFASGQLRSSTANSGLGLGYRDNGTDAFTVAYTRYGDANLDLKADINDFALLAANFNTPGGWDKGNFNYDALVNISDFALLAANFNLTAPAAGDLPRASVPEPVGALAVVAAAGLLSRNRRR